MGSNPFIKDSNDLPGDRFPIEPKQASLSHQGVRHSDSVNARISRYSATNNQPSVHLDDSSATEFYETPKPKGPSGQRSKPRPKSQSQSQSRTQLDAESSLGPEKVKPSNITKDSFKKDSSYDAPDKFIKPTAPVPVLVEPYGPTLYNPDSRLPFFERAKIFVYRHRKAFIAIISVIALLAILFFVDKNMRTVTLTIPADSLEAGFIRNGKDELQPREVPVRVLAYNAVLGSPIDLLYYVDTKATVTPADPSGSSRRSANIGSSSASNKVGSLSVSYEIPDSARYRSTYNEICILDNDKVAGKSAKGVNNYCIGLDAKTNDTTHVKVESDKGTNPISDVLRDITTNTANPATDTESEKSSASAEADKDKTANLFNKISCTYYVPAHTVGFVAWITGWDRLGSNQLVGCAGGAKDNGTSFGDESFMNSVYGFSLGNLSINGSIDAGPIAITAEVERAVQTETVPAQ